MTSRGPRRILVTGITGFAGSHLAELLVTRGDEVHGFAFEEPPFPNLHEIAARVQIHRGDITSVDDVRAAVRAARPDVVLHLAGQAVPTIAARDPASAVRVNVVGTAAVIASLEDAPAATLVLASSADVYGEPSSDEPVTEEAPVDPINTYAATKVAAEALVKQFADAGHAAVIIRATNQIGPRQHPGLVASAFARQIADAERGGGASLVRHGSLDARRDFVDVRDMADAYARATEIRGAGVEIFNVGSGRAVAIDEILRTLVALATVPVRTELDPERVRADVAHHLALDASRFRARTGWRPRVPLATSLRDLLDYWRAQLREGARV